MRTSSSSSVTRENGQSRGGRDKEYYAAEYRPRGARRPAGGFPRGVVESAKNRRETVRIENSPSVPERVAENGTRELFIEYYSVLSRPTRRRPSGP